MNRRNFFTLTAGTLLGNGLLSGKVPPPRSQQNDNNLRFTQQRTGARPFHHADNGRPPHILLISADMVSPDFYHPTRPLSQHVRIPNIRSLMQMAHSFPTPSAPYLCALRHEPPISPAATVTSRETASVRLKVWRRNFVRTTLFFPST